MLLRKVAIMARHQLYVRYDPSWMPVKSMLDLYELLTYIIAARCLPLPLKRLQAHVVCPLWRTTGYTVQPFFDGASFLSISDLVNRFPAMKVDVPVHRAYALLLHICCSPSAVVDLPSLLHDPEPHEPACHQIVDITGTAAVCPPSLQVLPKLVELSRIQCLCPSCLGDWVRT